MRNVKFMRYPWFKGQLFMFNEFFFNGGKCYHSYRLGPIGFRVYE